MSNNKKSKSENASEGEGSNGDRASEGEGSNEGDDNHGTARDTPMGFLKLSRQNNLEETWFPLFKGKNVIGREFACQVTIRSKAISRKHCCIKVANETSFVKDLDSKNRTFLNGNELVPNLEYEVHHNDALKLMNIILIYVKSNVPNTNDSSTASGSDCASPAPAEEGTDDIPDDIRDPLPTDHVKRRKTTRDTENKDPGKSEAARAYCLGVCVVCTRDIWRSDGYRELACGHYFHVQCLDDDDRLCPACFREIVYKY